MMTPGFLQRLDGVTRRRFLQQLAAVPAAAIAAPDIPPARKRPKLSAPDRGFRGVELDVVVVDECSEAFMVRREEMWYAMSRELRR